MPIAELTEIVSPPDDGGEPVVRPIDTILTALRAGVDRETNERRLFALYYRLVRHFLRQNGCTTDEAEDLCQETFLRLFERLATYRGEARFETWMLRIAENVRREALRKASTAKRAARETSLEALNEHGSGDESLSRTAAADPTGQAPAQPVAEPLRRLLDKEKSLALMAALDELPPQMGQCLRLRINQELSYREIAEVLQLSIDTVKVQLHRGKHRLRHLLAGQFDLSAGED